MNKSSRELRNEYDKWAKENGVCERAKLCEQELEALYEVFEKHMNTLLTSIFNANINSFTDPFAKQFCQDLKKNKGDLYIGEKEVSYRRKFFMGLKNGIFDTAFDPICLSICRDMKSGKYDRVIKKIVPYWPMTEEEVFAKDLRLAKAYLSGEFHLDVSSPDDWLKFQKWAEDVIAKAGDAF